MGSSLARSLDTTHEGVYITSDAVMDILLWGIPYQADALQVVSCDALHS